jgi:type IV pilus assembly protein PilA
MKYTNLKKNIKQGFSLVEMLVVIAVIGVIAAIAIPNIGNVNAAAKNAKDQRNAQSIASVFAAGSAAGVSWVTTSAALAAADVVAGRAPTDGAFSGKKFVVPGMSGTDVTAAVTKLTMSSDNMLVYTP